MLTVDHDLPVYQFTSRLENISKSTSRLGISASLLAKWLYSQPIEEKKHYKTVTWSWEKNLTHWHTRESQKSIPVSVVDLVIQFYLASSVSLSQVCPDTGKLCLDSPPRQCVSERVYFDNWFCSEKSMNDMRFRDTAAGSKAKLLKFTKSCHFQTSKSAKRWIIVQKMTTLTTLSQETFCNAVFQYIMHLKNHCEIHYHGERV